MRQFGSIPTPADAEDANWNDLSPEEQASFIRQGYRPPMMTIMSNAAYTELENQDANRSH